MGGLSIVLLLAAACSGHRDDARPTDAALDAPAIDADADARPDVATMGCSNDVDCDDRIACTVDRCRDHACAHDPCGDCCGEGSSCDPYRGCVPDAEACTTDDDCVDAVICTVDSCRSETCVHAAESGLCGAGKVCEPHVGCIPPPPDHCETVADCQVATRCVAEWSCVEEFGCIVASSMRCDDSDDCTDDACIEEHGGCLHAPRDRDLDGYGDATCGADDCDDLDRMRRPGADEACNGIDDDCDDDVDEGCCHAGAPCETECDSVGMQLCNDDGSHGACAPPGETCDGADQDCDGAADDGFACHLGEVGDCPTICGSTGSRNCAGDCSWDDCAPPAETCNGVDDDCDSAADDGFECRRDDTEACMTTCGSMGVRTCSTSCAWGPCIAGSELCNGMDDNCNAVADETFECVKDSAASCRTTCGSTGTAPCSGSCTLGACTPPSEICNGVDDDCDAACDDGFACCRGATAPCSSLGMGFDSGTARCSNACSWDTSSCSTGMPWSPTGVYTISPHVAYRCAQLFGSFYLVNYDFSSLRLSDTGTALILDQMMSRGFACTSLSGASAIPSRSFDVSCSIDGTCIETYRFVGTFTNDDTFTATVTSTFTPNGGSCDDCVNQTVMVTGTR